MSVNRHDMTGVEENVHKRLVESGEYDRYKATNISKT